MKSQLNWGSYFFSPGHSSVGDDEDLVFPVDLHVLGHAVRVAGVVDVSGKATAESGINDSVFVQAEHVGASILQYKIALILFL